MWNWLLKEENRKMLSLLGGGLAVVIGGLWAVYTHFDKTTTASVPAPTSITIGNIKGGGDTLVGSGTIDKRAYYGINDIALAKQLGVAESAVANFFKMLDQQHTPIEKWDHVLRQLAERYKELRQQAAALESDDPDVQKLQVQARQAIDAAEFEQAESLLDKAVDLDNAAAEKLQANYLKRKRSASSSQALKAKSLHTRFALSEAIIAYQRSIELAQQGKDEGMTAEYRSSLGVVYSDLAEIDLAIVSFELSLNHYLSFEGEESTNVAGLRNSLGNAWQVKGDYDKAIDYYEKALAVFVGILGEAHPLVAKVWNNLGATWRNKGDYDKAVDYYEKALAINIETFGEAHPRVARVWNNLGLTWGDKGDHDKAIDYYEKALAVFIGTFGGAHPSVAVIWNNMGLAWRNKGDYDKAIDYYEKALAINIETFEEAHPRVASVWNNLGGAWGGKGDHDKAIDYLEKALAMSIEIYGEAHPDVARVWNNLGSAWGDKGDHDKAIDYYEKALPLFIKFLGEDHPYSQSTIAEIESAKSKSVTPN